MRHSSFELKMLQTQHTYLTVSQSHWVRNIYSLIHNNACCWHLQVDKKNKIISLQKKLLLIFPPSCPSHLYLHINECVKNTLSNKPFLSENILDNVREQAFFFHGALIYNFDPIYLSLCATSCCFLGTGAYSAIFTYDNLSSIVETQNKAIFLC